MGQVLFLTDPGKRVSLWLISPGRSGTVWPGQERVDPGSPMAGTPHSHLGSIPGRGTKTTCCVG